MRQLSQTHLFQIHSRVGDMFLANIDAATNKRDATIREKEVVTKERDVFWFLANIDAAANERDAAIREKDVVTKERDAFCERVVALEAETTALSTETEKYKWSPAFDGFMHQEYANGMREGYTFLKKDVAPELLGKAEAAILVNEKEDKETMARRRKLWRAHCQLMRLSLLDMHTEVPPKDEKPTYFAAGKEGTLIMGARPNERLIRSRDYSLLVSNNEKEVVLTSDDKDIENEDAFAITFEERE
ncbi:hypothetical protein ACOSP7_026682 [Xanthoceras sorbifolium]